MASVAATRREATGLNETRSVDDSSTYGRYKFSSSGAVARESVRDENYTFLSFLEAVQRLSIDILPIAWQPTLGSIGLGGTAAVRQALVNADTSFAFKCVKQLDLAEWGETRVFKALTSEILVLGYASIRRHPNIITLEGVCLPVSLEGEKIWPVLVFEKTEFGDLSSFLKTPAGKMLTWKDRVKLCSDIASAVITIHSNRE